MSTMERSPKSTTPTNRIKKRKVGFWIAWIGVISLLVLQVKRFGKIHQQDDDDDTKVLKKQESKKSNITIPTKTLQKEKKAALLELDSGNMKVLVEERRHKNKNISETLQELKEAALLELDIGNNESSGSWEFEWPIIPTSGYRKCLNQTFPNYTKKPFDTASPGGLVSYMGVVNTDSICHNHNTRCVELNEKEHSFEELSEMACQTQLLICGTNASMICGMLGLSTRTYMQVAPETLETWPEYMWEDQYDYQTHNTQTLAKNHRLFWDRHTIQSNHPIMRSKYEHRDQTAFNVYFYTMKKLCPQPETSPERHNHIIRRGNMGDIYATHLADYFIKKRNHKMDFFTACGANHNDVNQTNWPYNITMSMVGSWATPAMKRYRSVLLGVGTISDKLEKLPLTYDPRNYVMGVRGPFTRDSFLLRYGWNPSISADPGLYANQVFQNTIKKETSKATQKRKLCFISHEVDTAWFSRMMSKFRPNTKSAGGTNDIYDIIRFMAQCQHIVSSSLHGVIFAHSLSIPAMPINVADKLNGGDWKFYDYYHGINVTDFTGRFAVRHDVVRSITGQQWIGMVQKFPQPALPFDHNSLHVFEDFLKIFPHPHGD